MPWRAERGSGSVLVVALVAATVAVTGMLLPVAGALVVRHRVAAAADSAALAAADTASGLVPGYPCEAASTAARLARATLADCALNGAVAVVAVSERYLVFDIVARARAGPAGSGTTGEVR